MESRCFARRSSSVSGTFPKSPSVRAILKLHQNTWNKDAVSRQAASSSSLEAMTKLNAEEEEEEKRNTRRAFDSLFPTDDSFRRLISF